MSPSASPLKRHHPSPKTQRSPCNNNNKNDDDDMSPQPPRKRVRSRSSSSSSSSSSLKSPPSLSSSSSPSKNTSKYNKNNINNNDINHTNTYPKITSYNRGSRIYAHSIPRPPMSSFQTRKFCVTFDDEDEAQQGQYISPESSYSNHDNKDTDNNNNNNNNSKNNAHDSNDDINTNSNSDTIRSCHLAPIRMPLSEFTEQHYEKYVVYGRTPVVLCAAEECREAGDWTPMTEMPTPHASTTEQRAGPKHQQGRERERGGRRERRGRRGRQRQRQGRRRQIVVPVRYQAVEYSDDRRYCPLQDGQKALKWVLEAEGVSTREEDPDYDEREGLTTVMYVKDWDFGITHPHWLKQLRSVLPRYLWWQGIKDAHGYLPVHSRVRNLVAYLGFTNSRTPLHVDKIYNIAVNVAVHGDGHKVWRVIDDSSMDALHEALGNVGGSIYAEDFWLSSKFLDALPIRQYVFEQHRNDIVLIPPDMPHQVMNAGNGYLLALAYNVLHPLHLQDALQVDKLNRSQMYPSLYRVKAMIYHAVITECTRIHKNKYPKGLSKTVCQQHLQVAKRALWEVVREEMMIPDDDADRYPDVDDVRYTRSCDVCRADIFNRRFSCPQCDQEGGFDVCVKCYKEHADKDEHTHEHTLLLYQRYAISKFELLFKRATDAINGITQ